MFAIQYHELQDPWGRALPTRVSAPVCSGDSSAAVSAGAESDEERQKKTIGPSPSLTEISR
jgi:hypothetical protein